MNLIYIYGPPGVGKLTVSRELSRLSGYRLFHNQLSIEFVHSVFEFGTPQFNRLVLKFRAEVIEAAAASGTSLIFTSAYAKGVNDKIVKGIIRRVEKHGGKVFFVQLCCDKAVLLRRVAGRSRKSLFKIRSSGELESLLEKYDHLSAMPFVKSLRIDNTCVPPEKAARMITRYCRIKCK